MTYLSEEVAESVAREPAAPSMTVCQRRLAILRM